MTPLPRSGQVAVSDLIISLCKLAVGLTVKRPHGPDSSVKRVSDGERDEGKQQQHESHSVGRREIEGLHLVKNRDGNRLGDPWDVPTDHQHDAELPNRVS